MVSFGRRLADAWEAATGRLLPLVVVPLVASLLQFEKVGRVLAFRGGHVGGNFRFPAGVTDLWAFVSLPNQGGGVHVGGPPLLLPALVVVQAALAAGYFGAVRSGLATGDLAFVAGVRRRFLPLLGYSALTVGLGLLTVGFALAGGPGAALVLLVAVPAYLVLAYLFYATPYLVVVRDDGLLDALAGSYRLAVAGGAYLSFGLGYLLAVAGLSVVVTAVVVNLGPVGLLLGLLGGPLAGLTLDAATMRFVMDLVDGGDATGADRGGERPAPGGEGGTGE